jgi:hypothetical protein
MNSKGIKIAVVVLGVAFVTYSAYLYKKAFVDKGYGSDEAEKDILLGYYVLYLGLENNKQNRDKYRGMTIEQLKKALNIQDQIIPE